MESKSKNWKELHQRQKELRKKWKKEKTIKELDKEKDAAEAVKSESTTKEIAALSHSTVSIAVPGSIMDNAQSPELRTYLAGQIARAACVYRVDEIIIFDDYGTAGPKNSKTAKYESEDGVKVVAHCCMQLARIIQYLECPQYLRKFFFPLHKDLKFSGLLNPLDAPHHLRTYNEFAFREGVVTSKPARENRGAFVNIGLLNDCFVNRPLPAGLRVTVKLEPNQDIKSKKMRGTIVPPHQPTAETGIYWGYTVRIAETLTQVFSKSPYPNGYDLTVGTSDKGKSIHDVPAASFKYNHMLIVFGGLQGLDSALENDDAIEDMDASLLFDQYINVAPNQGSRTIRTEEAILITLAGLQEKFDPVQKTKEFDLSASIPQSSDTGTNQHEIIKRKIAKSSAAASVTESVNDEDAE